MSKLKTSKNVAGSKKQNEPRLVGSIVMEVLHGWNPNTELSVDLKTLLRGERRMTTGREYLGVLRRDWDGVTEEYHCRDAHFTFVELERPKAGKRNPHVFEGRYITVTRRDDGSLHPNFKELPKGDGFELERYIVGVSNELMWALEGLVEE